MATLELNKEKFNILKISKVEAVNLIKDLVNELADTGICKPTLRIVNLQSYLVFHIEKGT
jgi:hypothetical protein